MDKTRCEICGTEMTGFQCNKCGWVMVHLPQNAPQKLKEIINNLKTKMKESHRQNSDNQKKISEMRSENQKLNETIKTDKEKIKEIQLQIEEINRSNKDLKNINFRIREENDRLNRDKASIEQQLSGAQLRIEERSGKYILFDTSGSVRRGNGSPIGKSGIELTDGYVFCIGDVRFRVTVPEFNIDNLKI